MAKLPTFLAASASLLLLAPLTSSQAQSRGNSRLGAFSGGGAGRDSAIASASGARGGPGGVRGYGGSRYYGGRSGYRGYRTSRYYYRGGYYAYDPFFFGGFGYPSYYYGAGYGYGYGYDVPLAYYGGGYPGPYYGDHVYNGRVVDESDRRDGDRDRDDRRYSPGSLAGAVQRELKERGYYKGRIDGEFGESSSRALRAFQRDKGISASGRLNERTLEALGFEQR